MCFLSVTASTLEERLAVETFRSSLPSDLQEIVHEAEKLFDPPDKEPPERSVKHSIHLLPDTVPIKRRPYPLSELKLQEMRTQIKALVDSSWVEPSTSPWGAPILFVPKKDKAMRMCVDFRDLNAVTIDDSYPLPCIEVVLHRAARATHFSKIDLASGFHQIEVEPASRHLTAFRLPEPVCGSSLWQWKVMPFGLRNAPPTFQRAMGVALEGCEHCSVVYIDDILIFSQSRSEHLRHLQLIFQKLSHHSYHARLAKCEFLKDEVEFLGHTLNSNGIATAPDKVKALREWPVPFSSAAQTKSFLGLVMWYRSFIPHLATIAAPLFALTSTKTKFQWTPECGEAVERLKSIVAAAPVLARWEGERDTRLISDASKVGLGRCWSNNMARSGAPSPFGQESLKTLKLGTPRPTWNGWRWSMPLHRYGTSC